MAVQYPDQQKIIRVVYNLFRHLTRRQLTVGEVDAVYPAVCEGVVECSPPRRSRQVNHVRAIPPGGVGSSSGNYYEVRDLPPDDENNVVVKNRPAMVPEDVYLRLEMQEKMIRELVGVVEGLKGEVAELRGMVKAMEEREEEAPPTSPIGRSEEDVQVLVADDIAMNIKVIAKRLASMGITTITTTSTSRDTTHLLNTHPYTIAFLDTDIPGMNTYHLLSYIRSNPTHPNHSTLFVSLILNPSPIDRDKSRAAGFDGCVPKPVETNVIKSLVTSLLQR
eukprot:TRINITY_DN35823_c0_g1_i1.p1 TRINITY_DN35823_c0_g1~~TRINITY_DN35823_c0_g1_i1.p1  ORF type:complete len:303 (+),score=47.88 TRINITY_DN35823_c0_g1_i1:77-910(+)